MASIEVKKGDTVEYWYSVSKRIKRKAKILNLFTEFTFLAIDLTTKERIKLQKTQILKVIE